MFSLFQLEFMESLNVCSKIQDFLFLFFYQHAYIHITFISAINAIKNYKTNTKADLTSV